MNKHSIKIHLAHPWTIRNGFMEAPATLMVEGVHHGSHGPIYWAPRVLKAAASTWEGIPLTLNHPEVNGRAISINHSPEIRAKYAIGKVINPYFDETKKGIRAILQVPVNHPKSGLIQSLREVSVGIFSEETETYGSWRGEKYSACAIRMEPDHLAILAEGQIGACSFEDSCGIRANSFQILQQALVNAINFLQGDRTMKHDDEYCMGTPMMRFYEEGRKKPKENNTVKTQSQEKGHDNQPETEMLIPLGVK